MWRARRAAQHRPLVLRPRQRDGARARRRARRVILDGGVVDGEAHLCGGATARVDIMDMHKYDSEVEDEHECGHEHH